MSFPSLSQPGGTAQSGFPPIFNVLSESGLIREKPCQECFIPHGFIRFANSSTAVISEHASALIDVHPRFFFFKQETAYAMASLKSLGAMFSSVSGSGGFRSPGV